MYKKITLVLLLISISFALKVNHLTNYPQYTVTSSVLEPEVTASISKLSFGSNVFFFKGCKLNLTRYIRNKEKIKFLGFQKPGAGQCENDYDQQIVDLFKTIWNIQEVDNTVIFLNRDGDQVWAMERKEE